MASDDPIIYAVQVGSFATREQAAALEAEIDELAPVEQGFFEAGGFPGDPRRVPMAPGYEVLGQLEGRFALRLLGYIGIAGAAVLSLRVVAGIVRDGVV